MEWKIGEIFEFEGEWYQCIPDTTDDNCNNCFFQKRCSNITGDCSSTARSDGKSVAFKKLEKVGEPYPKFIFGRGNIKVQRYKLYRPTNTNICNGIWIYHWNENLVDIEIKQNKEDMEETSLPKEDNPLTRVVYAYVNGKISDKELIRSIKEMSDEYPYNKNNLKPFSLELARQGKPVCTRDGRKAIYLITLANKNFPVVAIVSCGQEENIYQYDINGICDEHDENLDLMMLPEKKEGWVNVYKGNLYDTESEAKNAHLEEGYINTIKIEWRE